MLARAAAVCALLPAVAATEQTASAQTTTAQTTGTTPYSVPGWLNIHLIDDVCTKRGWEPRISGTGETVVLTIQDEFNPQEPKTAHAYIGPEGALELRAFWDSPHTKLGDMPIVNDWNTRFRFAKVSIAENPTAQPTPTQMTMSMNQWLYAENDAAEPGVRLTMERALEIFRQAVVGFDNFVREAYRAAQKRQREEQGNAEA
eukprot:TRINITY_DN11826_c0_g1_i1.p1 TRINITY_DN11826_c0_g1~~TRINITY_DN11826_c0_g1_i1.p1  ORF type:complete len:230 (+),score=79.07 TRINITY_DN11826_c0_g1_i1:87-692(+)